MRTWGQGTMQGSKTKTRKPDGIILGNETKIFTARVLGLMT